MTRQESLDFFLQSCIDSLARITEEDRIAARYSFYEMPDKQGLYKYNKQMRAYIEIRSYEKTVKDAMQRNSVLTER